MHRQFSLPLPALLAWAALWVTAESSISLCASANTGSDDTPNFSTWQSNGNCEEHCSNSAFGVLLGKNCWCSDVAPNKATIVDTSKCDDGCPGYPDDMCGKASKGYYAYIQLGVPSSTAGASTTTTTTKSSTSTTTTMTTTTSSTTESVSVSTDSGGHLTTVTVPVPDSTSTSNSDAASNKDGGNGSGMNGGTIAGIVVGVVGGVALIVAAIMFFLAKRRARAESPDPSHHNNLLDGRQSKGSQMSYAKFSDNHSHTLSAGSSVIPQRMPTFTDNRLNTEAVLYPNGRRDSDVSLQDNADYSRPVLRLTNPD